MLFALRMGVATLGVAAATLVTPSTSHSDTYIVFLRDLGTPESVERLSNAHARRYGGTLEFVYGALGGYAIELPSEQAEELGRDPDVNFLSRVQRRGRSTVAEIGIATEHFWGSSFLQDAHERAGPQEVCQPPGIISPPTITGSTVLGAVLTGYVGSWGVDQSPPCRISRYSMTWERYQDANSMGRPRITNLIQPPPPQPPNEYDSYTSTASDTGYGYRISVIACASSGGAERCSGSVSSDITSVIHCAGSVQKIPTGVDRIEADFSSKISGNCQGVPYLSTHVVGVIDTGIGTGNPPGHPDLNIASGTAACINETDYGDTNGHGTSSAGVIGALDDGVGVVGVVPGTPLRAIKIAHSDNDLTEPRIICGIDDAAMTLLDSNPNNNVKVANLSTGFLSPDWRVPGGNDDENCGNTNKDPMHQAVCNAAVRGVTIVTSAGNFSQPYTAVANDNICGPQHLCPVRPAIFNEVLTVTGVSDYNGLGLAGGIGSRPSFCNEFSGDDVFWSSTDYVALPNPADAAHTIAAPAVCTWTTYLGGGYWRFPSGTSIAAPHVTGVVSLCLLGPCAGLTPSQIIAKIISDSQAYSASHPDFGYTGDPLHPPPPPPSNRFYGYLVQADTY